MGFDVSKHFAYDQKKAEEGVRIYLLEEETGPWVQIARLNNPAYKKELVRVYRANRIRIEQGLLSDNQADEKMCGVLARTILLGWGEFEHKGQPQPYSVETATRVLLEQPLFREFVVAEAQNMEHFRAEELASEGKSSESGSDGT